VGRGGGKRVEELWKGERKRLASFTSIFFVSVLCFLFFGFFWREAILFLSLFFKKTFFSPLPFSLRVLFHSFLLSHHKFHIHRS